MILLQLSTFYRIYIEVTACSASVNLLSLSVMVALAVSLNITTPGSVVVSIAENVSCSS